jgi:hypothetical protein
MHHDVNVIGHHGPGEKVVRTANAFSEKQGFGKDGSNPRLA